MKWFIHLLSCTKTIHFFFYILQGNFISFRQFLIKVIKFLTLHVTVYQLMHCSLNKECWIECPFVYIKLRKQVYMPKFLIWNQDTWCITFLMRVLVKVVTRARLYCFGHEVYLSLYNFMQRDGISLIQNDVTYVFYMILF